MLFFAWSYGTIKVEKWQSRIFEKKKLIWKYSRKGLQISLKSDTLIFFSKTAMTIFLVFGLKLVLNMTFNLNETYFSEKFAIWRYLTSKSSKNCPNWGHFLDFASLVFLGFAHNDRWAWCLVVFLQFAGPVNVFLFLFFFVCFFVEFLFVCLFVWCYVMDCKMYYRVTWNQIEINNKINK